MQVSLSVSDESMSNCAEHELSHNEIMVIYRWFQSSMHKAGRTVKMPANTDSTKTYQYRWIKKFANRAVNEWHLDMKTIKILVDSIVAYGGRNNLLDQGTNILNMNNVLNICVNTLESAIHRSDNIISSAIACKAYLERHNLRTAADLAAARRTGGYSNLVCLVESGIITIEYLALSRKCNEALEMSVGREQLPTIRELFKIRARLLLDKDMKAQLKDIFGTDLQSPMLMEI